MQKSAFMIPLESFPSPSSIFRYVPFSRFTAVSFTYVVLSFRCYIVPIFDVQLFFSFEQENVREIACESEGERATVLHARKMNRKKCASEGGTIGQVRWQCFTVLCDHDFEGRSYSLGQKFISRRT